MSHQWRAVNGISFRAQCSLPDNHTGYCSANAITSIAFDYLEADGEYSHWLNSPDDHPKTYRQPGASQYQEVEDKAKRLEDRFREATGFTGTRDELRYEAFVLTGRIKRK